MDEELTLQKLKERPINPSTRNRMKYTMELSDWNINAYRKRMETTDGISSNVYDMTHNGNDPKSNKDMLDDARMFVDKDVYTDEQWEKYFIPAINDMISYNNNFVRWKTGYLIKEKSTGKLSILEYDYGGAFGGRDYTSLSVCELDESDNILYSWSWANYDDYELVDKGHTKENIQKMKAYFKGKGIQYYLCDKLIKILYE